jgi:hypothetical protein
MLGLMVGMCAWIMFVCCRLVPSLDEGVPVRHASVPCEIQKGNCRGARHIYLSGSLRKQGTRNPAMDHIWPLRSFITVTRTMLFNSGHCSAVVPSPSEAWYRRKMQ